MKLTISLAERGIQALFLAFLPANPTPALCKAIAVNSVRQEKAKVTLWLSTLLFFLFIGPHQFVLDRLMAIFYSIVDE